MEEIIKWVSENPEIVVPVLVIGLEWVSRKIPKVVPILKLLDKLLDKTPGFKNKE